MLVLTRKALESIEIGRDVKIVVLRIDRNQVRIGIDAPEAVHIVRTELVERDKQCGGSPDSDCC